MKLFQHSIHDYMAIFKYEICKERKRLDGTYHLPITGSLKEFLPLLYVTKEDMTQELKIKNQLILDELKNIISTYRSKCNTLSLLINDMEIDDYL